jgi:hypothetical protein
MIRFGHQTMIGVKDQEWFAAKFDVRPLAERQLSKAKLRPSLHHLAG